MPLALHELRELALLLRAGHFGLGAVIQLVARVQSVVHRLKRRLVLLRPRFVDNVPFVPLILLGAPGMPAARHGLSICLVVAPLSPLP